MISNICESRCCIFLHHDKYGAYCSKSGFHLDNTDDEEGSYCIDECHDYNNDDDDD